QRDGDKVVEFVVHRTSYDNAAVPQRLRLIMTMITPTKPAVEPSMKTMSLKTDADERQSPEDKEAAAVEVVLRPEVSDAVQLAKLLRADEVVVADKSIATLTIRPESAAMEVAQAVVNILRAETAPLGRAVTLTLHDFNLSVLVALKIAYIARAKAGESSDMNLTAEVSLNP
ncbi:hypothetical protein HaLaN_21731, partial [Haematococcus lacustris]